MPGRGERSSFGFSIAYHAGHNETGIVEGRSIRMRDGIAQFSSFVDGPRGLGRDVAWNPTGERKLFEQFLHPLYIPRDVRIDLAIGPFQIGVGDKAGTAVTRTGDVDHVQVVFLDDAIEVHVNKVQAWRGAPMPQQSRLDVLQAQRLLQQRVIEEIDLPDRQVIGRTPVSVDSRNLLSG